MGTAMMRGRADTDAAEREEQMWQLRLQGYSLREIAETVGVSHATVRVKLEKRINEMITPLAEEYRKLQDARLDAMLKALWPKVQAGDVQANNTVIKLFERHTRLMGYDLAPGASIALDPNSPINLVIGAVMVDANVETPFTVDSVVVEEVIEIEAAPEVIEIEETDPIGDLFERLRNY